MNELNRIIELLNHLNKKISNLEMKLQKQEWVTDLILSLLYSKTSPIKLEDIDTELDKYIDTMKKIEWETMDDDEKEHFKNDYKIFYEHEEFKDIRKVLKQSLTHSIGKITGETEEVIKDINDYKERLKERMEQIREQENKKVIIPENSGKITITK